MIEGKKDRKERERKTGRRQVGSLMQGPVGTTWRVSATEEGAAAAPSEEV